MGGQVAIVLYVVAMAAAIAGAGFVFFRSRFRERLTVNIAEAELHRSNRQ